MVLKNTSNVSREKGHGGQHCCTQSIGTAVKAICLVKSEHVWLLEGYVVLVKGLVLVL